VSAPPPRAPRPLALGENEVHVWIASLDDPGAALADLLATLAPPERERAERFHFPKHRDRWIVARGVLRAVLGGYLGRAAAALEFDYNTHGKPALRPRPGDPDLRFNLSHSEGLALYGVSLNREIGADVEALRRDFGTAEIAERFFSPAERSALRALPPDQQCDAFFACWTRKEAYIKARGRGLSLPLDAFDVSLAPGEPAALLATRDDPAQRDRWSVRALDPGPGFAGAVMAEGHGWTLRLRRWSVQAGGEVEG
jgi:4'-phosphopantetheinyl transferase